MCILVISASIYQVLRVAPNKCREVTQASFFFCITFRTYEIIGLKIPVCGTLNRMTYQTRKQSYHKQQNMIL